MNLRPYQALILTRQQELWAQGKRRLLICLPTGAGKTVVAVENLRRAVANGYKGRFIAHREELVAQASDRLKEAGVPHGVVKAGWPMDLRQPVQVCSVQTLCARPQLLQQLSHPRLLAYTDECHRVAGESYRQVHEAWAHAYHVGLTATPYRLDGKGMGDHFDAIIETCTPHDLIEQGYLVEPVIYAASQPDLKGLRRGASGDYSTAQLEERVASLTGDIVPTWQRLARGLPTVCFAVSIKHSQEIAAAFRAAGVPAAHIDGGTPADERRSVLERLAHGELLVVSNVDLLTEGWDGQSYARPGRTYRPLAAMIAARPTASMGLWFQMVGRLTRPGKDRAVLLDHAGNSLQHGLLRYHHAFTLDGCVQGRPVKGRQPPGLRRCPMCAAVSPPTTFYCPECRQVLGKQRELRQRSGDLDLLDQADPRLARRAPTTAEKVSELIKLLHVAQRQRFKLGWAYHRYRERMGADPTPEIKLRAMDALRG